MAKKSSRKKTNKKTKVKIQKRKPKRVSAKLRNIDLKAGNKIGKFPEKMQKSAATFEPAEKLERERYVLETGCCP